MPQIDMNNRSSILALSFREETVSAECDMELNFNQSSCGSLLKALADDTRLSVVKLLLTGAKSVGDLNAEIGIEQSLLSHHLRVLRDAKLVEAERTGKQVVYSIAASLREHCREHEIDFGCCAISFDKSA